MNRDPSGRTKTSQDRSTWRQCVIVLILTLAAICIRTTRSSSQTVVPAGDPTAAPAAVACTWETLLPAWLSFQTGSLEQYGQAFLYTFYRDEYDALRNDEFQLRPRVKQAAEVMAAMGQRFDPDTQFLYGIDLNLGMYDFEKQSFPVENVGADTYWTIAPQDRRVGDGLPYRFYIFFQNPGSFLTVPMEEQEAGQWVQSRKDNRGYVNRKVKANLRLRIIHNGVGGESESFRARVLSGVIYDPLTFRELHRFTEADLDKSEFSDGPPDP